MEDGLVPGMVSLSERLFSLNPCCNGRWSRTAEDKVLTSQQVSLNPCCNGRWSRTRLYKTILIINKL